MHYRPITIRTDRLLLRPWLEEDLEPFAKLNADPRVREFFPSLLSREESDKEANLMIQFMQERGWGFWAIEVIGKAKFIGFIGIEEVDFSAHFTPAVEIGWRLAFDFWGHGYATEGAKAALRYGFENLKLEEIVAMTTVTNKRSQRVMEKLGMHYSSADDFDRPTIPMDCKFRRHVLYRIKRKEWKGS